MTKVLMAGWFSFEQMGATAGDLLSRDLACRWLEEAGIGYDVALAPPFERGVDWASVDPAGYTHVVFVCGPFGNGWPITEFLPRFAGRRLIGVNLSMLEPLHVFNPFDDLIERDSSEDAHPDLSFASRQALVPVVGVVRVHPQKEYGEKARHQAANQALERLIASREMSAVHIDTRLDVNATGLRSPAEVESLIARMDVVLTTRLHGLVLALKNGVPVVAVDPIAGGAKILRQADTIGWPIVFTTDALRDEDLQEGFDHCLTEQARAVARRCAEDATTRALALKERFLAALESSPGKEGR